MTKIVRAFVRHHAFGDSGECVAIVSFDYEISIKLALDVAYKDTNTIDHPWKYNHNVEMVGPAKLAGGCRSTSVGDWIVLEMDDGSAEAYLVEPVGFRSIGKQGRL